MSAHPLDAIFHPRGIAVVGASPRGGFGMSFVDGLMDQGYHERHALYPVNPRLREVGGLRCYPSLLDCPDPVDHVISQIPAAGVLELLAQCAQRGVRSLHLFTAGFAETHDEAGIAMERELVERARAAGVRLLGPNCMGLYVPAADVSFSSGFPKEAGNVFVLSQSGANTGAIVMGLAERGLRCSKAISFGNGADIDAPELFEYAAEDPESEIVAAYIEGVRDGRAFMEAVKRCARVKPTVILKGGVTAAGARATRSHTASLAGSRDVFEAVCRQAGAIRVARMDDLHDTVVAVSTRAAGVAGRRLAHMGRGGGHAVLAADAIVDGGLELPEVPRGVQEELRDFIAVAGTSVDNPIDIDLDAPDDRPRMRRAVQVVARSGAFDALLVSAGSWPGRRQDRSRRRDVSGGVLAGAALDDALEHARITAQDLGELQEQLGIPLVAVQGGFGRSDSRVDREFAENAHRRGVAVFPTAERAARALARVQEWQARRQGLPEIF